ncbi:MAG: NPCBM/NEW2 domain-containing protein [Bacteroidales bacterium]|nr:NPCBM/NEW2 domain-containing protein [Bacteroidales bacterium]
MKLKKMLLYAIVATAFAGCNQPIKTIYLDEMDLSKMEIDWGENQINKSVDGNPLSIGGERFERGVGTHAESKILVNLHGKGKAFFAKAGLDDESGDLASVEFFVMGDGKILWQSGLMKNGDPPKNVEVALDGIQKMALYVSDGGDYIHYDHADWANAYIEFYGEKPVPIEPVEHETYILTPPVPKTPRINYPRVYGAGRDKPVIFRIPASGERPLKFSASGLSKGLTLDATTGIITGKVAHPGSFDIRVTAENDNGKDTQDIRIHIGHKLALTPPMGWNSWNCWGLSVTQDQVKAAADAFVNSGLADHGWAFINIDDGWEAAERTNAGELLSNEKFPDMKALADHVHAQGLKLGIYSSPGTETCGGYLGSWEHELQDARTWASWGIDYLKYDWCSYGKIATDRSLEELQKPYRIMRKCLDIVDRDIIYSLCQYGMGDVSVWGEEVGGNLWRTTGDITDSWSSMAGIGFSQNKNSPFAKPGSWNDPDMLVVGQVGWGPDLRKTKLTPDEQYTHISLWSMLAAPLLIGCDLSQLDDFTLSLLTNDEVIAVNQDPMGMQATKVFQTDETQGWKKELLDGSIAIGLFYTGKASPEEAIIWDGEIKTKTISVSWDAFGISGKQKVRDLWRQKDLGIFEDSFESSVNYHGVVLLRFFPE